MTLSTLTTSTLLRITDKPSTLTARVVKGNKGQELTKGDTLRGLKVTYQPELKAFSLSFTHKGRAQHLWVAQGSNKVEGQLSLNTGDPTQRVIIKVEP